MCGNEANTGLGESDGIGGVVGPLFRCSSLMPILASETDVSACAIPELMAAFKAITYRPGDRLPSFVESVDIYARGGSSLNTDRSLWVSELPLW